MISRTDASPRSQTTVMALLLASIGFIYAVKTTSPATAAFLGSTTPLFGVVVARLFLGERIHWRTYLAITLALVGLVVMFTGDADGSGNNIIGDLAALSSAAGFAFYAAIVRSAPDRDWTPVLPGYGAIMVRTIRQPPNRVPRPIAVWAESTTHSGTSASLPTLPSAIRRARMIPIVFWASLAPCPRLKAAAEKSCRTRNVRLTLCGLRRL